MFQDLRHIIVLDFRTPSDFAASHLRKSVNVSLENYQQVLVSLLAGAKDKQSAYKSHYEGDHIKRVLFILPSTSAKQLETQLNTELPELNEVFLVKALDDRIHKAYFHKDYSEIEKTYPFLCVGKGSSEKDYVRAEARYPSEIKKGSLFMGNMINVLDRDGSQLAYLGIKTVVYFGPKKFEHLEANTGLTCHHVEANEVEKPDIDMDVLSQLVITEMKKAPVFVFDISGILSAALCVKVMLETNRAWSKEIATAFIINKRYEAKDMPAWLYQQITLPGQKKLRSTPLEYLPQ